MREVVAWAYAMLVVLCPSVLDGLSRECMTSLLTASLLSLAAMSWQPDRSLSSIFMWLMLLWSALEHVTELSVLHVFVACAMLSASLLD